MNPLHDLGELLRWACGLVPLTVVRGAFVALPLVLMVWVLRLPTAETAPPGHTGRWDENLKLWAWLALAMQVVIYCVM